VIALAVAAVVGVAVLSLAYAAYGVFIHGLDARSSLSDARAKLAAQDAIGARGAFDRARREFSALRSSVSSPLALPARVVPVVGTQLRAVSTIARAGEDAADAGTLATAAIEDRPAGGWGLVHGRVDLAGVARAAPALRSAAAAARRSADVLERARRGWLLAPVASFWRQTSARLDEAAAGLAKARDGVAALPSLVGGDGPRRYVVAFANPSEMRGSGGFLGYFSMIECNGGKITLLAAQGRPTDSLPPLSSVPVTAPDWLLQAHGPYSATRLWQNVNTPADFPAVGSVIVQGVAPALGGVDGVIQIDPEAIAKLLEVTGPVRVPLWPDPITSANVARVTEHDEYVVYADRGTRSKLIGQLVSKVFGTVLQSRLSINANALRSLGSAADGSHVQVYSAHPDDEAAVKALGIAGAVDRTQDATDVLGVVTENASANKADWFLQRRITYDVSLDPNTNTADARLAMRLTNLAPASGEPSYVIGPNTTGLRAGDDRQILIVLRPMQEELGGFAIDGRSNYVVRASEDVLRAYHAGTTVAAGSASIVTGEFLVPDGVRRSGDTLAYRLRVLRQPTAFPDAYDVRIRPPAGWDAEGPTAFRGTLDRDLTLDVTLHRSPRARVVEALFAGPWRLARSFFGR
jgi:hypothetical protein